MTDEQLREIRERVERTCPGPENVSSDCKSMCADIPALLDEIDRLRKGEVRSEWRCVIERGGTDYIGQPTEQYAAERNARLYAEEPGLTSIRIQHRTLTVTTGEWREYQS